MPLRAVPFAAASSEDAPLAVERAVLADAMAAQHGPLRRDIYSVVQLSSQSAQAYAPLSWTGRPVAAQLREQLGALMVLCQL